MVSPADLLESIQKSSAGINVAELLLRHPQVPRRTAQRWIQQLLREGKVRGTGKGRARRYLAVQPPATGASRDVFPDLIPLSADSRDILAYVDQPLQARTPVGYQRDFLDDYEPDRTWYLPAPLRAQLRRMGDTGQADRPAGTYGRAILNRLLIDLSWASSNLEGNTYTLLDTRQLIEHGKAAQGKPAAETQMILNHKAAIELLIDNAETVSFNRYTILNLHSALSENLLPNPSDEGRLRQHAVEIGKSIFRPLSIPAQIDELFGLLLEKAAKISDPYEQSFFVMVHLPYLQPFADVNKRTSRLAANLPLIRANLCPLTFLDVPEQAYSRAMLGVYELTRVELLRDLYVWAYERSTHEYLAVRRHLASPDPLRLAYREAIRKAIRQVVTHPDEESLIVIDKMVAELVKEADRPSVRAIVIEELRRVHEGTLARYGLRQSEFLRWQGRVQTNVSK
jgi:fido (protein-threonine AMPylation protein)